MSAPAWLWLLAITLVWPVPAVLARARLLLTVPRAAVVLWQAVAVAALLATFGAALATIQALVFNLFLPRDGERARIPDQLDATGVLHLGIAGLLLVLTVVALVKLNYVGIQVARRLRRHRSRHRDLIDLLSSSRRVDASGPSEEDVRVLRAGEIAYAYCLPGRDARVVISDAALRDLSAEQVAAVIEHERAHLRARHDLLLEFFTVLYEAAGRRAGTQAALEQSAVLVELLADDAARRLYGPQPLIAALATMGGTTTLESPGSSFSTLPHDDAAANEVTGLGVLPRLRRLVDAPVSVAPPGLAAAVYAGAVALIAVPTLAVALPWLTSTWDAVR
ncbi:M56 family metallopeptidase [Kineosporia succinea]|uniref:Zn-dependent protease with chaperone function n=1 Tax=Kineosporia succinea TaxID=84632 RepID=A0ABT9P872_9ACTN|nr:M56 family metallopeptidase [Kineosporia succinea]MDP9828662.1 Zn-dependent protease with chaperone function [Kineosporia succinea]